jgi:hypothetical protein
MRGFVILAQNTESVDYIKCAKVLAESIKQCMPNASVSLITDNICDEKVFDNIIPLPHGDLAPNSDWKLINDWQVYDASPYDETIKLEADLYIPASIDYWWDTLSLKDVVVSTNIRNYKGTISDIKFYRNFIYNNKLPDTYNALTYFKKSELAENFFHTVREIFENWEELKTILKCNVNEEATTDWVYALACHVHGIENTTMPFFTDFSMVHMKKYVNDLLSEDWTTQLVYEILPNTLRVNTFTQRYPFHYHVKHFASIIENAYTRN